MFWHGQRRRGPTQIRPGNLSPVVEDEREGTSSFRHRRLNKYLADNAATLARSSSSRDGSDGEFFDASDVLSVYDEDIDKDDSGDNGIEEAEEDGDENDVHSSKSVCDYETLYAHSLPPSFAPNGSTQSQSQRFHSHSNNGKGKASDDDDEYDHEWRGGLNFPSYSFSDDGQIATTYADANSSSVQQLDRSSSSAESRQSGGASSSNNQSRMLNHRLKIEGLNFRSEQSQRFRENNNINRSVRRSQSTPAGHATVTSVEVRSDNV